MIRYRAKDPYLSPPHYLCAQIAPPRREGGEGKLHSVHVTSREKESRMIYHEQRPSPMLFGIETRRKFLLFSPLAWRRGGSFLVSRRVAYVSARRGSEPWGKNIRIYIYIGSPVGNAGSQIHQAPTYIVGKVIVDFREVFVVG